MNTKTQEAFEKWYLQEKGEKPSFNRDHEGSSRWDSDKSIAESAWVACSQEAQQESVGKFKLVPIEPTPKMVDATWNHPIEKGGVESHNRRNKRIYKAMIEAYTHPAPAREPLSDDKIVQVFHDYPAETNDWASHIDFARAIEKAHGIGGGDVHSNGS
jgi:hypothetical protein